MRKRWKTMAVCAAFLLSLTAGCGAAEDLNATDTETAGNAVAEENMDMVEESTAAVEETTEESLTAGAYTYHLETEEMAWNTSDGEAALTVTLEYPVFEGNTEAEEAINTFYRSWATVERCV